MNLSFNIKMEYLNFTIAFHESKDSKGFNIIIIKIAY